MANNMANNIGKLYYKDYYKGVNFIDVIAGKETPIGDINDRIKESPLVQIPAPQVEKLKTFKATTLYPGLITGVGIEHGSKKITGGYELGMHFDYTMGMPIIYGSSVKGVLRSYFKEFYEGDIDADKLVKDIFEGKNDDKNKPIYERDIFFDAVITECPRNGSFLADDSITPHKEGPLKNPIPIAMLKIAPGCTFEFRFRLSNSVIDGKEFSVSEKIIIFKKILGTVGIGAKTNVGYGQLKIAE
jgi:CRISPR-associated protein Cmr6